MHPSEKFTIPEHNKMGYRTESSRPTYSQMRDYSKKMDFHTPLYHMTSYKIKYMVFFFFFFFPFSLHMTKILNLFLSEHMNMLLPKQKNKVNLDYENLKMNEKASNSETVVKRNKFGRNSSNSRKICLLLSSARQCRC